MLATLSIRGSLSVETGAVLSAYERLERLINGAQYRMILQMEGAGWPVARSAVLDEYNGIRRAICDEFAGLCLTTKRSSSGSAAS